MFTYRHGQNGYNTMHTIWLVYHAVLFVIALLDHVDNFEFLLQVQQKMQGRSSVNFAGNFACPEQFMLGE